MVHHNLHLEKNLAYFLVLVDLTASRQAVRQKYVGEFKIIKILQVKLSELYFVNTYKVLL